MLLNNGIFKLKVKLSIKVLSELGGGGVTKQQSGVLVFYNL